MLCERFVCGRARSNSYVFAPDGPAAVIVDAGVDAVRRIADLVRAEGLEPVALLLTHGHPDHIWTARALCDRYGIGAYVHRADARWLADPATGGQLPVVRLAGAALGRARRMRPRRLEIFDDRASLPLGFEVMHTPGHSRGSVCYRLGDVCFAGDTVFRGSPGAAIFPGGSRTALRRSIGSKLLPLPDDVRLLPGHGESSVVGAERETWTTYVGEG